MDNQNHITEKQGRGPNGRFLPTTSAEEARIAELENELRQANSVIRSLERQKVVLSEEAAELEAQAEELSLENTRLEAQVIFKESPLLPIWVQIAAAFIFSFLIAFFAHYAGYQAALEARR